MSFSPSFDALVQALTCLSGVGKKTAQRMALDLLLKKNAEAVTLAKALTTALATVQRCRYCRNLSDAEVCLLCADPLRNRQQICVVETPADVIAIEQATDYRGLFFVLMGHIAPLDGMGPEALGMDILDDRLANEAISELVLATNATLEGETTAYFLAELAAKHGIQATRLAYGVPLGSELSYIDKQTLHHAFQSRDHYHEL